MEEAGKDYEVIEAGDARLPGGRLAVVGDEDVLYIYADLDEETSGMVVGSGEGPQELAGRLHGEGLGPGHKTIKVFASNSGGPAAEGGRSFAERLYDCLVGSYPRIEVFGYLGVVSPSGQGTHKTAGMSRRESAESIGAEDWWSRKLRAKENRVRFPAG